MSDSFQEVNDRLKRSRCASDLRQQSVEFEPLASVSGAHDGRRPASGKGGPGPGELTLDHRQVIVTGPAAVIHLPGGHVDAEGAVDRLDGRLLQFAEGPATTGKLGTIGVNGFRRP